MRYLIVFIGFFVMLGTVQAGESELVVGSAYIREMPPGQTVTAAFMKLNNQGAQKCSLVRVSTPVATRAEIHGHSHKNGVMRMRPVDKVDVASGESVALQPGGYHVMLFGVTKKISDSEHYPLTLYFEGCPKIVVDAEVRSLVN